ncbi:MAG: hypothetical protein ACE5E1_11085 [Phycisphaerae bacterium]
MSSVGPVGNASTAVVLLATIMAVGGCPRGEVTGTRSGPNPEQLIAYYSPRQIKILPFSKPQSFDDDLIPDGIAVWLRPLDVGSDKVKAFGTFMFELYTYRPASVSHRGELIQQWTQAVLSPEDQEQFWDKITGAYAFQLSWEGRPLTPGKRFILVATFQAPGSERLFDEYEFEFRVSREEIRNALSEP